MPGFIPPPPPLVTPEEDVGGGFTYRLSREDYESKAKTAIVDDKWDFEFDDLAVSGSGTEGTAVIWCGGMRNHDC